MSAARPRILCVDDERHVLEGLTRVLRREFEVVGVVGGAAGIATLEGDRDFAVVVSDMRMPGVDGTAMLTAARRLLPEATRILLTGFADVRSAVAAVNQGEIFRFLTKPCPPDALATALHQGVAQHRLVTAERELLARTLTGCIQALVDVLGVANPVAFSRATRARRLIAELASLIGFRDRWQMEMAAMLSQVGAVGLAPAVAERLFAGAELSPEEEKLVAGLPGVALTLLGDIPRLEEIRAILTHVNDDYGGRTGQELWGDAIPLGARMLRVVLDFDRLRSGGHDSAASLSRLFARSGAYDPAILSDLGKVLGAEQAPDILELRLQDVRLGMVFVDDVRTEDGTLLVARGQEVTPSVLSRVANFWSDLQLGSPVRVTPPVASSEPAPA